jgi:hypothetical protein
VHRPPIWEMYVRGKDEANANGQDRLHRREDQRLRDEEFRSEPTQLKSGGGRSAAVVLVELNS